MMIAFALVQAIEAGLGDQDFSAVLMALTQK